MNKRKILENEMNLNDFGILLKLEVTSDIKIVSIFFLGRRGSRETIRELNKIRLHFIRSSSCTSLIDRAIRTSELRVRVSKFQL